MKTSGRHLKEFYPKEFNSWEGMIKRCNYPNSISYKWYGGRGIKVCDRWHDFEEFINDMGPMPKNPLVKYSLDRKDSDGNYNLENCRWLDSSKQSQNRRDNVKKKLCKSCNKRLSKYNTGRCKMCEAFFQKNGEERPIDMLYNSKHRKLATAE